MTQVSKRKRLLFSTFAAVCVFLIVIGLAETALRYWQRRIVQSDQLDPGLLDYDPLLGWKLTRNWQGQHRHHDFTAVYSTNRDGFRSLIVPDNHSQKRYAVLGDSFTFGYGVNDDQTFVQLLNADNPFDTVFFNFAVPGYSTDQELLLFQHRIVHTAPDHLLLIVYLGNDLFDNELPFPLQADVPKPYFVLQSGSLKIRNSPVPHVRKTASQQRQDLHRAVFWDDAFANNRLIRILNRFLIFQLLKNRLWRPPKMRSQFERAYAPALELFQAILTEFQALCREYRIHFQIALLPGKTYLHEPDSSISQSQDYLRIRILEQAVELSLDVIDLAELLKERYQTQPGVWFYPNEGHLTEAGHRVVAELLRVNPVKNSGVR